MTDYLVTDTELTSIANAIRTKGGTSASLTYPTGFVTAINNIPTGGTPTLQTVTKTYTPKSSAITENITPGSGYDGIDEADITVEGVVCSNLSAGNIKSGVTVKVGTATDDDSVTSVTGTYTPALTTKNITANGTYNASSDNVDGYSSVQVLVPSKGDLLVTDSLGTLSTSSTTATTVKTISVSSLGFYDALVVNCTVNTRTNSRHYGTTSLIWLNASSNRLTKDGATIATAKQNIRAGSNVTTNTVRSSTTAYGVYASACSISDGNASITISVRYNGTQTGTINGTYTARIYGINLFSN